MSEATPMNLSSSNASSSSEPTKKQRGTKRKEPGATTTKKEPRVKRPEVYEDLPRMKAYWKPDMKHHDAFHRLSENGYVVIKAKDWAPADFSPASVLQQMKECTSMYRLDLQEKPEMKPVWNSQVAAVGGHVLAQLADVYNVRSSKALLDVFGSLWGTSADQIWTSVEPTVYMPPLPVFPTRPSMNQNFWKRGVWLVQGFVFLTDKSSGGLKVWERSHQWHHEIVEHQYKVALQNDQKVVVKEGKKKDKKEELKVGPEGEKKKEEPEGKDEKAKKAKKVGLPKMLEPVSMSDQSMKSIEARCRPVMLDVEPGDLVLCMSSTIRLWVPPPSEAKLPLAVIPVTGLPKARVPLGTLTTTEDGKPAIAERKRRATDEQHMRAAAIRKQQVFLCGRTTSADPFASRVYPVFGDMVATTKKNRELIIACNAWMKELIAAKRVSSILQIPGTDEDIRRSFPLFQSKSKRARLAASIVGQVPETNSTLRRCLAKLYATSESTKKSSAKVQKKEEFVPPILDPIMHELQGAPDMVKYDNKIVPAHLVGASNRAWMVSSMGFAECAT